MNQTIMTAFFIMAKKRGISHGLIDILNFFKFPSLMHSSQVDEHPVKISGQNL